MAEVKTIRQYRTKQDGNTLIEFPVVDEESKNIIEVNFNQYIDVLSDILVKYAVNFRSGRQWVVPLSAKHKKSKLCCFDCLISAYTYIFRERWIQYEK
ncbi:MAG: hypothetical protein OSJ69_14245, partial [Acetatifactor sp.]|nr:hypothetical protein [Acetatifactor sp.]